MLPFWIAFVRYYLVVILIFSYLKLQPPQSGRPRPPPPIRRGPTTTQPETKEPPSSVSTSSSSDSAPHQQDSADAVPSTPSSSADVLRAQKAILAQSLAVVAKPETSEDVEMMETEPSGSSNPNPPSEDVEMEDGFKVYKRIRSRKSSVTSVQ